MTGRHTGRAGPEPGGRPDPERGGREGHDGAGSRGLSTDAGDARHRRARARQRRRRPAPLGSAFSLVLLVVAGLVLVSVGIGVIRNSTTGEVFGPVTDPAAPGFVAVVEPTPTLAVLHEVDGVLDAVTVLSLPEADEGGGGIVSVPAGIEIDRGESLAAVHDPVRPSVVADRVGTLLGVAIGEVTVVTPDRWARLVTPVAPLVIDNTDPLDVDGRRVPVGRVSLAAAQVGGYLTASIEGESDLARLFRHGLFWEGWLEAVGAAPGPDAVPGEVDAGLGRFVRRLSAGPADIEVLPVLAAPPSSRGPAFRADAAAVAALMAELVPLPESPTPGARPRVRLLNGTEDLDAASEAAPGLAVAGVSVVLVGNAGSLDHAVTTIVHAAADHEDEAVAIRDVLGVGRVVRTERAVDAVDITVTLGADHG